MQNNAAPQECHVTHQGVVESIGDTYISVRVLQHTACDTCRAKLLCTGTADARDSVVEAFLENAEDKYRLRAGSPVMLQLEQSMAWISVALAFGVPLLILLATFFGTLHAVGSELVGGLAALAVLLPYYVILGLNRHRLSQRVYFTATPVEHISV
ncbi:MAG: hypothetical protein EA428_03565 [Spirochaetaceae bacterium]|nr:MAG: hypothetical protein EA428_03565 [Spirochaetaceae bacterium]